MTSIQEIGISPISQRTDFLRILDTVSFSQLTGEDIEEIIPWNLDKYTVRDFRTYLGKIVSTFGQGWGVFSNNFTALDICCGGCGYKSEGFYPWWPAILSQLGADVTGIDIGDQPKELTGMYTHIQYDVTDLSVGLTEIPEIAENKFHLITCLNTINPYISSDVMVETAWNKRKNTFDMQHILFRDIDKLLVNGGLAFVDSHEAWQQMFRKTREGLIQLD